MMFLRKREVPPPLVSELAVDGIPVTVTCRVLKIARQPYHRWLAGLVTEADLAAAHRANALFDAHKDDPEFGYRFLADEAREAGHTMSERTAWRLCSDNGWWSEFGKNRGKNGKNPGPPVHEDRCAGPTRRAGPGTRSPPTLRMNCGWATSPNIGPVKESCTSARSRTSTPTGSWATPSTHR